MLWLFILNEDMFTYSPYAKCYPHTIPFKDSSSYAFPSNSAHKNEEKWHTEMHTLAWHCEEGIFNWEQMSSINWLFFSLSLPSCHLRGVQPLEGQVGPGKGILKMGKLGTDLSWLRTLAVGLDISGFKFHLWP